MTFAMPVRCSTPFTVDHRTALAAFAEQTLDVNPSLREVVRYTYVTNHARRSRRRYGVCADPDVSTRSRRTRVAFRRRPGRDRDVTLQRRC
jgi:hypothetical protein